MYWGALSTDIKKSSVNWNGLPSWMKKAVQYHNTVIETCVKFYNENMYNGTTVELLPNAPEGDAYTYLFKNNSMFKLKSFVTRLGTDIQQMLHELREDDNSRLSVSKCDNLMSEIRKETAKTEEDKMRLFQTYNLFQTKKYYGGIYIRIGVAFSDEPPIPYSFQRYRGGEAGKPSNSYRGSVIKMAEKAEEKAEFDLKSHIVGTEVKQEPVLKECYMEDSAFKFKDVYRPEKEHEQEDTGSCRSVRRDAIKPGAPSTEAIKTLGDEDGFFISDLTDTQEDMLNMCKNALDNKKLEESATKTGFCVFVEYHPVLSDTMAIKNPYTKTLINKEYVDIHEKADECIRKFIETTTYRNGKYYNGGLVKQKRDSTSMFVILNKTHIVGAIRAFHAALLYQRLSELLASLPAGSSIGFAYGNIMEFTMTREDEGTFTDYFQECVNLAARMVMRDWSFSTKWGVTEKNEHTNRLAFTSRVFKFTDQVETNIESYEIPFTLESIPLGALNAGGDETILCISSKFTGWKRLKVGDQVKNGNNKGIIAEDRGDTFLVTFERHGDKEVKRSELTLTKEKGIDDSAFKVWVKKVKL